VTVNQLQFLIVMQVPVRRRCDEDTGCVASPAHSSRCCSPAGIRASRLHPCLLFHLYKRGKLLQPIHRAPSRADCILCTWLCINIALTTKDWSWLYELP